MVERRDDLRWSVPSPFGHAAAIDSMGAIAAPLLAGFSITFAGLVVSVRHAFRWENLTLGCLLVAAFALVACLQLTFRARQWVTTPSEIEQWYPNPSMERQQELRREQLVHHQNYKRWSNRARWAYNSGILALILAVTIAMVPEGSIGLGRALVIVIAALALLAELAWVIHDSLPQDAVLIRRAAKCLSSFQHVAARKMVR